MFTFLVFFFNHLAYLRHMRFLKDNPNVETNFSGLGCLAFISIPADLYLIYLVVSHL